jgi:Tol biopolymer transport system component
VAVVVSMTATEAVASPATERASLTNTGGQANDLSFAPAVSADCRNVAFASGASNLVSGDTNADGDFFVRDRTAATTVRVDVATSGAQAGTQRFFDGFSLAISADGRFVAFGSFATNLVSGDTNGHEDIFVRDLVTGTTTRVSLAPGRRQFSDDSYLPSISADGRFIAFTTQPPTSGRRIWLRDRQLGTVRPVSVKGRSGRWMPDSQGESVSADGRWVAFNSLTAHGWQVYVHDMVTGTTRLKSVSIHGGPVNGRSESPSVSADGRYVAFDSTATDLVRADTNRRMDVFVTDRVTHTIHRVDLTTTGQQATGPLSGGLADTTAISPHGRYVAFSTPLVLDPSDTNHHPDVYVRDRGTHTTTRMSVSSSGAQVASPSSSPSLCAGPSAGFVSLAPNLVPNDTNGTGDIFLRTGP